MTGTVSRTATASPRGGVGRKPQAKLWPEEHEAHTRRRHVGEGAMLSEARSHPERFGVYATGGWSESHAQYPGRPRPAPVTGDVRLSGRPRTERGVSRGHSSPGARDEGPNLRNRTGPRNSTHWRRGKRAAMPERRGEASGGTAHGPVNARQGARRTDEHPEQEERSMGTAVRGYPPPRATHSPCVTQEPPYAERHVRWCGRRG